MLTLVSKICILAAGAACFTSLPAQNSSPLGPLVPGRFILAFRNETIPPDAAERIRAAGAALVREDRQLGLITVQFPVGSSVINALRLLAQNRSIEAIMGDRVVTAQAVEVRPSLHARDTPDSLYYSKAGWAVRSVGGFASDPTFSLTGGPWDVTKGAGVRLAILDSGVDRNHPDLAPNLALNLSEIDQTITSGLPSPCDNGSPQDQQGHGTWTASLAAGALGPDTGLVAGVAPAATLLNIKVLERLPNSQADPSESSRCAAGQAAGLLSWVIRGIEDAVSEHADIISMSFGTLVDLSTSEGAQAKIIFDRVTTYAAKAGVLLIAAAGNEGLDLTRGDLLELPAQASGVLAIVSSTNPACAENLAPDAPCRPGTATLPYYSNSDSSPHSLAAPGGSYPSGAAADPAAISGWIEGACSSGETSTTDGPPSDSAHSFGCFGLGHTPYVQAMGTSAATSLAAGAAALVRAAHPDWDAATILEALWSSATLLSGNASSEINVTSLFSPAERRDHQPVPPPHSRDTGRR